MTEPNKVYPRSTFVNAVAWVFIALAGFATLIAILQNIMISMMAPQGSMRGIENAKEIPVFAKFMFSHPQIIFGTFLAVSAGTFISAIGLLKRKNWARIVFIGLMGLGILWNIAGAVLPFIMFSSMPPMPAHVSDETRNNFELIKNIMMVFSILMTILFACLFGWIIKRLISPEIKQEFLEQT
jgi:cytochrome bd-type quinol oxidase subunit 2